MVSAPSFPVAMQTLTVSRAQGIVYSAFEVGSARSIGIPKKCVIEL